MLQMRHLLIAALAVTAFQGCTNEPAGPVMGKLDFVRSNGEILQTIEVEFAEDEETRATGLMHRRQLSLSQGMLFIFANDLRNLRACPVSLWINGSERAVCGFQHNSTAQNGSNIRSLHQEREKSPRKLDPKHLAQERIAA